MLKFRTLERDAETRLGPYLGEELVRRTEAEYTRIGRWLKASQLDEIPQLWNVLRGDMSFVGPRPIRARFFAELANELPAYWQRLVVRPGLTGFAQVRRGYETSMAEKLAHDLEWIADRSVPLYLRTLWSTGWRVIGQTFAASADRLDSAACAGSAESPRPAAGSTATGWPRCRRRSSTAGPTPRERSSTGGVGLAARRLAIIDLDGRRPADRERGRNAASSSRTARSTTTRS